jgi:hypothetical protein
MNEQSSSTGVIVGVLIVVILLIVGFLAYKQGLFTGKSENTDSNGIEINLGGNPSPQPSPQY